MNKQALIFIPLIFMFTISMFSLLGIEDSEQLGDGYTYGVTGDEYLYDYTGRPMIFTQNFSSVEGRTVQNMVQIKSHEANLGEGLKKYVYYKNGTYGWEVYLGTGYYLYKTSDGNSTGDYPILYEEYQDLASTVANNGLLTVVADFNSSYGLIALFISLMVGIGLAGVHFFGIGESETSLQAIFIGVGLIAVWVVFSAISLNLLVTIPYGLGAVFYFGLTLSYVVGLILSIGR